MICPEYLTAGLETAFASIQRERMADVPVLNRALAVQAVGFREWHEHCVGVLITPWFMNLMLLPQDGEKWAGLPLGSKITHVFPSGIYEFILAEEAGIGHYQMCSLFSPVFDFEDQAAAVATAEAVMECLMDDAHRANVSTREREIEQIWRTEEPATAPVAEADKGEGRSRLNQGIEQSMSRRDVLRGAFLGGKG